MNEIFDYYIKTFSSRTLSLKKKGILVDKPWALIDNDGEVQKLIFKRDNGLILSKNGKVKEGRWDYFPEAMALLIDRLEDKILLKEQFIDDNVLILKIDGTKNDFFALANENTISDYNIPAYLNSLRCKEFKIKEIKTYSGRTVQVFDSFHGISDYDRIYFVGKKIEEIDNMFKPCDLADGYYMTKDKSRTFYVKNGCISNVTKNLTIGLINGKDLQIEDGNDYSVKDNINKVVKIDGNEVVDSIILDNRNFIFEIKESQINKIFLLVDYLLKNGTSIKIEQKKYNKITKGDRVIDSKPSFPLLDGEYKIKGKWSKIKVKNSIVQ